MKFTLFLLHMMGNFYLGYSHLPAALQFRSHLTAIGSHSCHIFQPSSAWISPPTCHTVQLGYNIRKWTGYFVS